MPRAAAGSVMPRPGSVIAAGPFAPRGGSVMPLPGLSCLAQNLSSRGLLSFGTGTKHAHAIRRTLCALRQILYEAISVCNVFTAGAAMIIILEFAASLLGGSLWSRRISKNVERVYRRHRRVVHPGGAHGAYHHAG